MKTRIVHPTEAATSATKDTGHQTLCSKKITRFADKGDFGTSSSTVTGSSAVVTTACNRAFGEVILKTKTGWLIGPDGKETKTVLFADRGSHRTWILDSISKVLQLRRNMVENIATGVFREKKERPVVPN